MEAKDMLLTDEESFNLGFATTYSALNKELGIYTEGTIDGSKAQLKKLLVAGYLSPEQVEAMIDDAVKAERDRIFQAIEKKGIGGFMSGKEADEWYTWWRTLKETDYKK